MSKRVVCKWCGHSKSITKDIAKAYQQGRADAIDKFAKWEEKESINYFAFDNADDVVKRYFEQLKEKE